MALATLFTLICSFNKITTVNIIIINYCHCHHCYGCHFDFTGNSLSLFCFFLCLCISVSYSSASRFFLMYVMWILALLFLIIILSLLLLSIYLNTATHLYLHLDWILAVATIFMIFYVDFSLVQFLDCQRDKRKFHHTCMRTTRRLLFAMYKHYDNIHSYSYYVDT